jgi:hypothetical protein
MVGLQQWGTPLSAQIGLMPYGDLLGLYDAHVAKGRHYAIETRWLAELTPAAISALAGIGSAKTSPLSLVAIHHFHGAAARVPLDTTAFGLRRDHFLVEIVAVWEPGAGDDGAAHRHWARVLSRSLAPAALPGGYPNLLGPDEHDRAALAYGRNLERLKAIKKQFDPLGIFASAIPLPTGP